MAVTYTCDVCKKKTEETVFLSMTTSFSEKAPFKHLCQECWDSVIKFLKNREKSKKNP